MPRRLKLSFLRGGCIALSVLLLKGGTKRCILHNDVKEIKIIQSPETHIKSVFFNLLNKNHAFYCVSVTCQCMLLLKKKTHSQTWLLSLEPATCEYVKILTILELKLALVRKYNKNLNNLWNNTLHSFFFAIHINMSNDSCQIFNIYWSSRQISKLHCMCITHWLKFHSKAYST